MPTLSRWFDEEYERLHRAGKSSLAGSFDALRAAAFASDAPAVLAALPELASLADALAEPVWRLVAAYYAIFVETQWRGDLSRGLDLATQAAVQAMREPRARPVLALYLQESLLGAWLCAGAPGYADDVLNAADEVLSLPLPADLVARFQIAQWQAWVTLDPGCGPAALRAVVEHCPSLDWPEAYNRQLLASALSWAGRCDEALVEAEAAAALLEVQGHPIEATEARLLAGSLRAALGDVEGALDTFQQALSAAERSINRAHVGFAQAGIGRALIALEDPPGGAAWLGDALSNLSGLGWLHAQAEIHAELAAAAHTHHVFTITAGLETGAWRTTAPGKDTL